MLFPPYEFIIGKLLKFETFNMKHCFGGFDAAWAIARGKIERFIGRKERGELSENEHYGLNRNKFINPSKLYGAFGYFFSH